MIDYNVFKFTNEPYEKIGNIFRKEELNIMIKFYNATCIIKRRMSRIPLFNRFSTTIE